MNTVRLNKDHWAMGLAALTAKRASCLRRAVGCVLLNARGHVLATGYNGTPAGFEHCNHGKVVNLPLVKRSPQPLANMPTKFTSASDIYFQAALEQNPGLSQKLGGVLTPWDVRSSETHAGHMCVTAMHYSDACPGATAPSGTNLDGCHAIHAEQNALLQCKDVWSIETCYVTTMPCMTCMKLLLNTGCRKIFYGDAYPHKEAAVLWKTQNRELIHLPCQLDDFEGEEF